MSRELTVGKRYAKALFELAKEQAQIEPIEEELKSVALMFSDNETGRFFETPSIGIEQKLDVLNKALSGKVSDVVLHTLQLLVENRREDSLEALVAHYSQLADEFYGRATAIVYTPMPITDQESKKIADYFGKLSGKKIRIKSEVKPELLGGLRVRIGDRLYDGSLAGKLAEITKILA